MGSWGTAGPQLVVGQAPKIADRDSARRQAFAGARGHAVPVGGSANSRPATKPPLATARVAHGSVGVAHGSVALGPGTVRPPTRPSVKPTSSAARSPVPPSGPTPPAGPPPGFAAATEPAGVNVAPPGAVKRKIGEVAGRLSGSAPKLHAAGATAPKLHGGGATSAIPASPWRQQPPPRPGMPVRPPAPAVSSFARSSSTGSVAPQRHAANTTSEVADRPKSTAGSADNANNNKQTVKLRKIEAFSKQLIDEWISLDKDKQEQGFKAIAKQFTTRVPAEFLAMLAELFVADGVGGEAEPGADDTVPQGSPEANAAVDDEPVEEEAADEGSASVQHTEVAPAAPRVASAAARVAPPAPRMPEVARPAPRVASTEGAASPSEDVTKQAKLMVNEISKKPATEWKACWSRLMSSFEESIAIDALFEAALRGGKVEAFTKCIVELTRLKITQLSNVEKALQSIGARVDELFTDTNENVGKLYSHVFLDLFPKTPSTTWGVENTTVHMNWSWSTWWAFIERVVKSVDQFRAFDIILDTLQMMQEKSGCAINQLQVWKEAGRTARVRKTLGGWGEMDDAACVDTLKAYGVKL